MEELEFEGHRIGTRWKHLEQRERAAVVYIYADTLKRGHQYIQRRKLTHDQFWLHVNGQEHHPRTKYQPDDEVVFVGCVDEDTRRQVRIYMARRNYRPRLTLEI